MKRRELAGILLPIAGSALAALPGSPVIAAGQGGVKSLLFQAIDAQDGRAQGVVTGPIADRFRTTTGSVAPVLAEVTTLKRLKQEGCKRLRVSLSQAEVPTQDGGKTDFVVTYELNLCRDGSPPTEGSDAGTTSNHAAHPAAIPRNGAGQARGLRVERLLDDYPEVRDD